MVRARPWLGVLDLSVLWDTVAILLVLLVHGMVGAVLLLWCRWRTRDGFWRVVDIQLFVDGWGYRLNLRAELLLDLVEVESIIPVDEVDGQTEMSKSTGTTNSVEIRFRIFGEIKVDDNVDSLNIDTTGEEIGAY